MRFGAKVGVDCDKSHHRKQGDGIVGVTAADTQVGDVTSLVSCTEGGGIHDIHALGQEHGRYSSRH